MKIKLFTIPNLLTLSNLLCGMIATVAILTEGDLHLAFWLLVLAAVFDFFDGFTARLLHQSSPIGLQLDSLADMVSSGVTYYDGGRGRTEISVAVPAGDIAVVTVLQGGVLKIVKQR